MTLRAPFIKEPFGTKSLGNTQPLGSPRLLLAAAIVAAPFVPIIWGAVSPVEAAPVFVQVYNPNLYAPAPKPFAQLVWLATAPVKSLPPALSSVNYAGMYSAPFNRMQWGGGSPIDIAQPFVQPYANWLYTNPIPFSQSDWSRPSLPAKGSADVYQPWTNFYQTTVAAAPFYQSQWQPAQTVRAALPLIQPYADWLYTNPIPFAKYDWPAVAPISSKAADVYQPWANFYQAVVVTAPFYQSQWQPAQPVRSVPVSPQPYADWLYTNPIPFAQYAWPAVASIAPRAADVYQPWMNFYSVTVTVQPFNQPNWPSASAVRSVVPQSVSLNVGLYSVPFNQTFWPSVARLPVVPAQSYSYNSPLLAVLSPFYQSYWPAVQPIKSAPPQAISLNTQLYKNPIPFAQYDWPLVRAVRVSQPRVFVNPYRISSIFLQYRVIKADPSREKVRAFAGPHSVPASGGSRTVAADGGDRTIEADAVIRTIKIEDL